MEEILESNNVKSIIDKGYKKGNIYLYSIEKDGKEKWLSIITHKNKRGLYFDEYKLAGVGKVGKIWKDVFQAYTELPKWSFGHYHIYLLTNKEAQPLLKEVLCLCLEHSDPEVGFDVS